MIADASPNTAQVEPPETPGAIAADETKASPAAGAAVSSSKFKRLLVAVDDSEQAAFAVDTAARLAGQLGAELLLVNVFRADMGFTPEFAFAEPDMRAAAIDAGNQMLKDARARASGICVPAGTFLREGDPAEEIVDLAVRLNADLIVIGTHGRGRLGQALLGSVANSVARQALCPVMMVSHEPPPIVGSPGVVR